VSKERVDISYAKARIASAVYGQTQGNVRSEAVSFGKTHPKSETTFCAALSIFRARE